ncbi:ESX secretion-associated protein EspG [Nocardia sp. NPDC052566]|uniref:ESX secretion-associated protein EspG n=1 Tax=Nocardia sp. NPDC052566 TaxID=3364330 RepID=UPI0037CA550C
MASWSFESEEFAALWFGPANDRMLYPLDYLSRFPHINERDEYWARVRHDWSERGRLSWDEADLLTRAFTVLTTPEAWLEIHGFYDAVGPIRVAAARHARHAAFAAQFTVRPRIEVSIIPDDKLPAVLTRLLPKHPPGRGRPQRFDAVALRPENQPLGRRTGEPTPLQCYERLVRRPSTGAGLITVFRGPRHNALAPARKVGTVRWYDLPDGRYLETGTRTLTVRPGDIPTLQTIISRLLDHAVTEYRDHIEDLGEFAR